MRSRQYFFPAACLLVLSACSGGGEPANDESSDHAWKTQENAYRKAQEVAPLLDETDQRRRELMEEQGG